MEAVDLTAVDENLYRTDRLNTLASLENVGIKSYPHKFQVTISFSNYIDLYKDIDVGSRHKSLVYSLAGRIREKRESGKQLVFYTVESDGHTLQFLVDKREYANQERFKIVNDSIHRGDILGAIGFVGKSLRGELSLYPTELVLLTPCLKYIPKLVHGLKDPETRARKRYLDLIANPQNREVFLISSMVCKEIRRFLDERDFLEVHTPMLSSEVGGANAKPFITFHNDLKEPMYLRIAPELYLKKLVVGGLNRVYELGQQFRNEGADRSHNPEFLSLEYYMAYADYHDLIKMCEDMFTQIIMKINRSTIVKFTPSHLPDEEPKEITIDFTPPYAKIDIVTELKANGVDLPDDLSTEEARLYLDQICSDRGVECSAPRTTPRLLDKLIGEYIEPKCINPTFVMNHPMIMSPLAKQHRDNSQLTERFELFVCGLELANAYTELNHPDVQRDRFVDQQKSKNMGDDEAQSVDEGFLDALEYGLPPTGGFGCGIARLIMFLSNRNTIRDVIAFPAMPNLVESANDKESIDGFIKLLNDYSNKNKELKQ